MPWKPEYEANRRARFNADPEYAARVRSQRSRSPEENKVYMRAYYKAHPEKFKRVTPEERAARSAARRALYAGDAEHREAAKRAAREWSKAHPETRKAGRLKKYGITEAELDAILKRQGGGCAICGHSDTSNYKVFPAIDHCHTTKRVRGVLCGNCNKGIGLFKDDPARLERAASYLREAAPRSGVS
jgi:hypothetical protein